MKIKNIYNKMILAVVTSLTAVTMAFAVTPAKFYASTFDAKVGQTVEFELKVDPSADKPVYTAVVNLEYDKNLLTFKSASYQQGWIPVTPEEVTDTANGVIKRTAGYPAGAKTLTSIVKYSFVAKAPGKANVNIIGSSAYDVDSNDVGLQNKSITVNIGGTEVPEAQKAPEVVKEEKKVTQEIILSFKGDTGMVADKDYMMTVMQDLKVKQDTNGTTSVSIFDINGQEVLKQDKLFTTSDDNSLDFTIPAGSLVAGNYSIVVTSNYDKQKSPARLTKDLGVVNAGEKVVNITEKVAVIPVYIWIIIGILALILILMLFYNMSKGFRKFIKNL